MLSGELNFVSMHPMNVARHAKFPACNLNMKRSSVTKAVFRPLAVYLGRPRYRFRMGVVRTIGEVLRLEAQPGIPSIDNAIMAWHRKVCLDAITHLQPRLRGPDLHHQTVPFRSEPRGK